MATNKAIGSITELAKTAGVSVASVSLFFNNPQRLGDKTAEKIKSAVERYGFNMHAVRPGPKTSNRKGVKNGFVVFFSLINGVEAKKMLTMPALPILIGGIQSTLQKYSMGLIFSGLGEQNEIPACLSSKYCDGAILIGATQDNRLAEALALRLKDIPVVCCLRDYSSANHNYDTVSYDNSAVGAIAANYLYARGCRRAAVFNSLSWHTAVDERVSSFCISARAAGMDVLEFSEEWHRCEHTPESEDRICANISERYLRYCASGHPQVSGAFFGTDDMMLNFYTRLCTSAYSLHNIPLIGCNADEVFLRFISPHPATIDIRFDEIGRQSVELLMKRINGDFADAPQKILIEPYLKV